MDRRFQIAVADHRQHFFYILARTAFDGLPLRPVIHLQQTVVMAEIDKGRQRKRHHGFGGAGPDAGRHRQQIPVSEFVAIAMLIEELSQRCVEFLLAGRLGECSRLLIEAQNIAQHAQKAGIEQISALCKHGIQIGSGPLQQASALWHFDRERHIGRHRLYLQILKQPHQIRIGFVIKHQEAGIDAEGFAFQTDIDSMRMSAKIIVCLKQAHLRFDCKFCLGQFVGARQAGDAGTDDSDFHRGRDRC